MKIFKIDQLIQLFEFKKEAVSQMFDSTVRGESYEVKKHIKLQEDINKLVDELRVMEATLNTYMISSKPSLKDTLMNPDYSTKPDNAQLSLFKDIPLDNEKEL